MVRAAYSMYKCKQYVKDSISEKKTEPPRYYTDVNTKQDINVP